MDVRLRDVVEADPEFVLAYEHDPEAVRRPRFTPGPREAFLRHWKAEAPYACSGNTASSGPAPSGTVTGEHVVFVLT
ncbi:hypothetical protein [Streptomyces sp. NPDC092370]|uniref:hypothetical protein n=1 Tax=Streptomyces sp. NPDC092370 TaxID=3366016 RepID=UPI0038086320